MHLSGSPRLFGGAAEISAGFEYWHKKRNLPSGIKNNNLF